ncbi:alpha/beta hydrolase [Ideonella sp. A 288]|uniref:alpha/beta hydrolase n=1 Tax=Ideonella sp. A 288 TaxID=1962181 RepID=UPI000B4AE6E2|nr:alpha/beta hydrolase fold domain-containing protein [Ideonella sp. A 288]
MRRWLDMIAAGQSARRIVLDAGLHAAAGLIDRLPPMQRRMQGVRLIEDLAYAHHGGEVQRLDILQPAGPGPHPVILYLHGGAFAVGSKRTHRAVAAAYAARGYLVCNVDYRLAPQHPFPAAVEDACAAWAWAVDHVGAHGGDAQRIALAGESAGANLALAVVLACATPRPEPFAAPLYARGVRPVAALLYCGFLQASQPARYRRAGVSALAARVATDAARSYLGAAADQPGPAQALADPLCVVEAMAASPGLPPMFVAAGLADPVAADSQRLDAALRRLGTPCSAHWYAGEPHAFHVMFWRDNAILCWRDSFAFLHRHLPVRMPAAPSGAHTADT